MIDLKGHSGCKLLLINDDKKSFVRKISKDVNYNDRIKLQCKKQEKFKHKKIRLYKSQSRYRYKKM